MLRKSNKRMVAFDHLNVSSLDLDEDTTVVRDDDVVFGVNVAPRLSRSYTLEILTNAMTRYPKWRKWHVEEEAELVNMTIQGRSLDYIRLHLPRPDGADVRTENAIKSRIGYIYSLGLINAVEGTGNPRGGGLIEQLIQQLAELLQDRDDGDDWNQFNL